METAARHSLVCCRGSGAPACLLASLVLTLAAPASCAPLVATARRSRSAGTDVARAGTLHGEAVIVREHAICAPGADAATEAAAAAALAAATALRHPHLVPTHSLALSRTAESRPLSARIVHECCSGGRLQAALDGGALAPPVQTRPFAAVMSILRGVASGLRHMHAAGIAHGSLSPATIFLSVRPSAPACDLHPRCTPPDATGHRAFSAG